MYRRTYSNLRDCFTAFAMTYFTTPSLSGKQIKNPSTRITHKGAKRQKTHSPVKHYLVGFNGYNLSRSDDAQAPQAIKFEYSIFLFFRFVNDFDYNIFRHCPLYYPVIAPMPYFILPSPLGGRWRRSRRMRGTDKGNAYKKPLTTVFDGASPKGEA